MADPNNVKSIFSAASEKPAAERGAFLDEAVAGDAALRARVEALLKAHDNPDSFLEDPAAEFGATIDLTSAEHQLAERPGTLIGPYKLLEQIGEGGMGVVYMADQQSPVRRRVALKVIKTGMDTRQVIARFEAERQALALMDHTNIARVLDAGATDSGRPYFVMELVRGISITEYCDQNNLPVHERLELFVQVCHAVQHAHQKGIIHRDLKPSNVLVTLNDGRAVPKVIDFGVAKATGQQLTEKTLFTAFAQMVGTPLYMSPEQAEMTSVDIDTRSDIYSLGVLLYELLTGTTPFDHERMRAAAFDEIRRIIREEEPPRPSTRISTLGELRTAAAAHRQVDVHRLGRLLKGDLDWIVMRALEKDRTRRYDTAGSFAADVLRHLSDQPVEACPPSTIYRFRKFARRNRSALLAMSAMVTILVLLMLGLAVSNRLIASERDEKGKALALAKAESKRAEENFLRASIAIREVLTKAALGIDEWSNFPAPLRKRFAEEAANFYQSLLQADSPDPNRRYEAAVGYRSIGTLHSAAWERQRAEESFRRSIGILNQISMEYPAVPQYRHQLAWSHLMLSRLLAGDGKRRAEASAAAHQARRLYENLISSDPSDVKSNAIADLHAQRADDGLDKIFHIERLAICYFDLTTIASESNQLQDAEKWNGRIRDVLATRPAEVPMDVGIQWALGHVRRVYAFALERAGRYEEAEKFLGEALGIFETLRTGHPDTADHWHYTADTLRHIAQLMQRRGQHKQAEQMLRQSVDIHEQRMAKFPNYLGNSGEWNASFNQLAWLLATSPVPQQRNLVQAVELAKKAVKFAPNYDRIWNTLGIAQYRLGNWDDAVGAIEKSMELNAGGNAWNWFFLAMARWRLGDKEEARQWYDKAVEWMDKNKSQNLDLLRFRTEAAELLGISEPAPSTEAATQP